MSARISNAFFIASHHFLVLGRVQGRRSGLLVGSLLVGL